MDSIASRLLAMICILIENFWSKVKATLRKLKARTYKDLIEGIELAMLEVTQKDIRNWFTHCCYCTP
jgi:hypothetical protein